MGLWVRVGGGDWVGLRWVGLGFVRLGVGWGADYSFLLLKVW